ncbi:MAG: acetyl-CoA carboxylase biotin carboxylase subunit [Acidobacteriota bacterium]
MPTESNSSSTSATGTRPIRKVLIANRGEIAVRILRTLKDMGIRSAVVYSDADRLGLPVLLADEAYPIGPAPSAQSYLRADAIVQLALEIGADAIHPGYGFLSENAGFATRCREAGVIFIGPPPSAIAAMGSKVESRRLMIDAGVPVVPGGRDPLPDVESALAFAETLGYPVMVKAAAGGGGKGMRVVESAEQLPTAFRTARSEAKASFGDDDVYLEKFIVEPRHVEIQVLGDEHGNLVSLGERECSLQRRHQKVVEEAPSPVVEPELRQRMGEAAVQAARAVGYTNAGTVEFLLDVSGEFYFLEVNTRLQVEHPITELVTGLDLVEAQVRVARGEELPAEARDAQIRGHALELRLYAEDPFRGFVPSPGLIEGLRWPEGPGVRVDAGVYEGSEVSIHYDPMLAKLIFYGTDRAQALRRARRGLLEMKVEGIRTTIPLFLALLEDEDFLTGQMDISMLDRKLASGELHPSEEEDSDSTSDEAEGSDEAEAAGQDAAEQEAAAQDLRQPTLEEALRDAPLIAAALAHVEATERGSAAAPASGGRRDAWRQSARLANLQGVR